MMLRREHKAGRGATQIGSRLPGQNSTTRKRVGSVSRGRVTLNLPRVSGTSVQITGLVLVSCCRLRFGAPTLQVYRFSKLTRRAPIEAVATQRSCALAVTSIETGSGSTLCVHVFL